MVTSETAEKRQAGLQLVKTVTFVLPLPFRPLSWGQSPSDARTSLTTTAAAFRALPGAAGGEALPSLWLQCPGGWHTLLLRGSAGWRAQTLQQPPGKQANPCSRRKQVAFQQGTVKILPLSLQGESALRHKHGRARPLLITPRQTQSDTGWEEVVFYLPAALIFSSQEYQIPVWKYLKRKRSSPVSQL